MAFTTGSASINFQANDPTTFGLTAGVNVGVNETATIAFANGSGANGFNLIYQAPRTFSGTTDVLNLTSGLVDSGGNAIDAARIKGVFVVNTGNANVVVGAGTDPVVSLLNATGTLTLPPGAFFAAATPDSTGWVVTASTAMNLTLTGTSGQTYQIVLYVSNA